MPLVRPCRRPWCASYADESGWCDAHRKPAFAGSAPMRAGWSALRLACLERDGWICADCGGRATDADHVIPRALGGPDTLENLRALCGPCHHRRTGQMFGR